MYVLWWHHKAPFLEQFGAPHHSHGIQAASVRARGSYVEGLIRNGIYCCTVLFQSHSSIYINPCCE